MALEVPSIQAGVQAAEPAAMADRIPRVRCPQRLCGGGLEAFLGLRFSSYLHQRGRARRRTRPGINVSYQRCTWLLHRGLMPTSTSTSMVTSMPISLSMMEMWKWKWKWKWTAIIREGGGSRSCCRCQDACICNPSGALAVRLENESSSSSFGSTALQ